MLLPFVILPWVLATGSYQPTPLALGSANQTRPFGSTATASGSPPPVMAISDPTSAPAASRRAILFTEPSATQIWVPSALAPTPVGAAERTADWVTVPAASTMTTLLPAVSMKSALVPVPAIR